MRFVWFHTVDWTVVRCHAIPMGMQDDRPEGIRILPKPCLLCRSCLNKEWAEKL